MKNTTSKIKIDIDELAKEWILRGVKVQSFPSVNTPPAPKSEPVTIFNLLLACDAENQDEAMKQMDNLRTATVTKYPQLEILARGVFHDGVLEAEIMVLSSLLSISMVGMEVKQMETYPDNYLLKDKTSLPLEAVLIQHF